MRYEGVFHIHGDEQGVYNFTDAISDSAAAFINDHCRKTADKPFFSYAAYTAPPWPLMARDRDIAKYKGRYDAGWGALRKERRERMVKMGIIDRKWTLSPRDTRRRCAVDDAGAATGRKGEMSMERRLIMVALAAVTSGAGASGAPRHDYPIEPVPFTAVRFADEFWSPRMETNREVTVPCCFKKCEETGRIANFARAGGLEKGAFEGIPFNDSDVYKVIEGAAYSLSLHPDPKLDKYLDELIVKIAAAQENDGYLYTARRLFPPERMPGMSGRERWSNMQSSHELYNVGHLYEAAAAHFRATGKRALLDVACKNADLLVKTFGPEGLHGVPGHEEIEIGLVKLFRVTGNAGYLTLAQFFIDERGNAKGHKLYGEYAQDHMPVVEQTEPVGHAVRAGYLYAGMTDVAALTDNEAYRRALDRIWADLLARKIYLTGGVGAVAGSEGFGAPYVLPNKAYNETCAAVAMALWNHRMFLLHGDAKYIDVLERIVYNGFLSGIALSGDRFFYRNPLIAFGQTERSPWFDCACCPVNVVRFVPSLAGYLYAVKDDAVYVNLYAGGTADVDAGGGRVKLTQATRYPWDGKVTIRVDPGKTATFTLNLRVPGWARNEVMPGELYRYADDRKPRWSLSVNGAAVPAEVARNGYIPVRREWRAGDEVVLDMTMPVRRVVANEKVEEDRGRAAMERGPLVYCFEEIDNRGGLGDIVLDASATFETEYRPALLGGVTVVRAKVPRLIQDKEGTVTAKSGEAVAVPYYAWAHRGKGRMAVWMAATAERANPVPPPSIASRSRVTASFVHATLAAVNDQAVPANSVDHNVPWFDWWGHRGVTEWLQYDFEEPARVSEVQVYWFQDAPTGGGVGLPASWRVLYREGDKWLPVENPGDYVVKADQFNTVTFRPVKTDGLRLEVKLADDISAGVHEWRVR